MSYFDPKSGDNRPGCQGDAPIAQRLDPLTNQRCGDEFCAPLAVDVREDGQMEVLDPSLSRISRFAPTDSGLVLTTELTTPVRGFDFCRLNGDYYLLTYVHDDGGIVTALDSTGRVLRRFARSIGTIPRHMQQHAECSSADGTA